jgi:hypothetical protein
VVGVFARKTGNPEFLQVHLQVGDYVAVKWIIEVGGISTVNFPFNDSLSCISHLILGRQ